MLSRYKQWVKRHPGVVQNFDWLLLLTVWNPNRTNGGFEFTYEAYHAAVGLLSLWHQNILEEGELPTSRPAPYLWLDAIEHLETLIELRGMHLENQGKMSRYGPLLAVELVKAVLKMSAWSRYSGHMFLRRPAPDDLHQFESEQGLQDILGSLERLHRKYTAFGTAGCADGGNGGGGGGGGGGANSSSSCIVGHADDANMEPGSEAAAAAGSRCAAAAAAGAGRTTYGIREYVGEWAAALAPARLLGGSGGCGGKAGLKEEEEEEEGQQQQQCCRAASGGGCSTSPRCAGDAAAVNNAQAGITTAAAATGASSGRAAPPPLWKQRRWRWHDAKLMCLWQQQQQQGCEAEAVRGSATHGSGMWAAAADGDGGFVVGGGCGGCGEDPDAHMGRNLLWLSELLHIWRPVVYVTLLKRYGRRSWRPWSASLAVDLLSGHFHRRGRQHLAAAAGRAAAAAAGAVGAAAGGEAAKDAAAARGAAAAVPTVPLGRGTSLLSLALARSLAAPGITAGEERELYDRRRKLVLYALRSPFLEATTLSWLAFLRDCTRKVPLLGFGADYLYGLVETFTAYYCYTSGSN